MTSPLQSPLGFAFTTLVEAQRGMTDTEIARFLATGDVPDLSVPPIEPVTASLNDTEDDDNDIVLSNEEVIALLSNTVIAAGGFFTPTQPHYELNHNGDFALWRRSDHPRGFDGKFINKGASVIDALGRLDDALSTDTSIREATPITLSTVATRDDIGGIPARDVRTALTNWEFGTYKYVNSGLRSQPNLKKIQGKPGSSDTSLLSTRAVQQTIAGLDAVMSESKLTQDVRVSRGLDDPQTVFGNLWSDNNLTGLTWRERGFSSTSTDNSGYAYASRDGVILNMLVRRGTGAVHLENTVGELLLQRDVTYRVIADSHTDSGRRMLTVEVEPSE